MSLLQKVKYAKPDDKVYKDASVAAAKGAPYLVPTGTSADYNVHGEYMWTVSPKAVIDTIPRIELIEYRLKFSAELLSLINSAKGFNENFARINLTDNPIAQALATAGAVAAGSSASKGAIDFLTKNAGQLGGLVNITTGAVAARIAPIVGNAATGAVNAAGIAAAGGLSYLATQRLANPNSLLLGLANNRNDEKGIINDPYNGLYYATLTNIKYTLPYISVDNMISTNAAWKEPGSGGVINKSVELGKKLLRGAGAAFALDMADFIAEAAAAAATGGEPGAAREKIKGFIPTDEGDKVTVVFYLFNTIGNIEEIQKNWEFLYTLTYQNLPNRRSINLLDPPCVYQVNIPGYKRFPVANIESLKVTNEGITKYIDVTTGDVVSPGTGNSTNIKMIPEAYKVQMTIRSLLTPTQNLFSWSDGENIVKVEVFKDVAPEVKAPVKPPAATNQSQQSLINQTPALAAKNTTGGFGGGPNTGTGGLFMPRGGFPRR